MGLINNDVYETATGVQKVGSYVSFTNEVLYLNKNNSSGPFPSTSGSNLFPSPFGGFGKAPVPSVPSDLYTVRANYRVFWDKDARDAGKSFIELKSVSMTISSETLSENLYTCLYSELKKLYPNSSDA